MHTDYTDDLVEQARRLYVEGGITLPGLVKQLGGHHSQWSRKANAKGWHEQRESFRRGMEAQVRKEAERKGAEFATKVGDTRSAQVRLDDLCAQTTEKLAAWIQGETTIEPRDAALVLKMVRENADHVSAEVQRELSRVLEALDAAGVPQEKLQQAFQLLRGGKAAS